MTLLSDYWFAALLLLTGAGLLGWAYARWKAGGKPGWGQLLVGGALACFGLGGVIPHGEFGAGREAFTLADVGFWIAVVAVVLFAVKLVVLCSTGNWWAPIAAGLTGVILLGLG